MTTDEREDWQNLIGHPGFLRLSQWARENFSEKLMTHVGQAADERDDAMALNKLRQVIAAKNAIDALLEYPVRRMAFLEDQKTRQAETVPSMSRRGLL